MKTIRNSALIVALVFVTTGANAALVEYSNYTADTSSGLDWLDLSATVGQSVTGALSSNSGWSYANDVQVSGLLSNFGITYGYNGGVTNLNASFAQATSFVSLLGSTYFSGSTDMNAALGGYWNEAAGHSTYLCISTGNCGPASFTYSTDLSNGNSIVGQFLVRNSLVSAVPEPETYAMLLAGLGLLGFAASRRKDNTA